jgi:uncharacterized protein YozE (UPF0346 family)
MMRDRNPKERKERGDLMNMVYWDVEFNRLLVIKTEEINYEEVFQ